MQVTTYTSFNFNIVLRMKKYWDYKHASETEKDGITRGTGRLKYGFAEMLKGGVIMDVTNADQARIAERAGAVAVMVLDKLPADVRKAGSVARTASIEKMREIMDAVSIPVMAKCRIGHSLEAKVLEAVGIDMVDESEVLTPADEERHIWKWLFQVPFVCGARDLGEGLRRVEEGTAMIRTKGEPGTGNVAEAIRHLRQLSNQLETAKKFFENDDGQQLLALARSLNVSMDSLLQTCELGHMPVVNFSAGGIATPADAAQLMQMGADGVFVGSGIFNSEDPDDRAKAIVLATTYFNDIDKVLAAQRMIDEKKSMSGLDVNKLELRMQERGARS